MKRLIEKTLADGKRRVTVELSPGEKLIAVDEDRFYRLGYPVEDIVGGHVLAASEPVAWCAVEQRWAEAGDAN